MEIVESYYAVFKLGAVVVPLNSRLVARELLYQLSNSESKAVIFGDAFRAVIDSIRSELEKEQHYICGSEQAVEGNIDYEQLLKTQSAEEPLILVAD